MRRGAIGAHGTIGAAVSLLANFYTVYPIIDVPNPLIFGAKIASVTIIANALGIAIFFVGQRRRRPTNLTA